MVCQTRAPKRSYKTENILVLARLSLRSVAIGFARKMMISLSYGRVLIKKFDT